MPETVERDSRITGDCIRCGACCVLSELFSYKGKVDDNYGIERLTPAPLVDHRALLVRDHPILGTIYAVKPCPRYDFSTKSCRDQKVKHVHPVCVGWPFFVEDLEKISCRGFKVSP